MLVATPETLSKQRTFFKYLFRDATGFLYLGRRDRSQEPGWGEEFFKFPDQLDQALEWAAKYQTSCDIYFCAHLLTQKKRVKDNASLISAAWADLDSCPPSVLRREPTITIESSPGRFQAFWCFNELQDPADVEDINRRIAYGHLDEGADKSGWDLTQLLRVPFTGNHKYRSTAGLPVVRVVGTADKAYDLEDFDIYQQVKGFGYSAIPFPEVSTLEQMPDAQQLLERYRSRLVPTVWHLIEEEPEPDVSWSHLLWQLEMMLFEGGLAREEVFIICDGAACNKYRRDGRPKMLWKEVCRAFSTFEANNHIVPTGKTKFDDLLSAEEHKQMASIDTLISQYIKWGREQGDAAWQYHQAGGFLILSSLLSGRVRLPTSFGTLIPNLWFMILADTTLTRKTTAMDLAVDLLAEVDSDAILATDGSIEGLFTALAMRPGRPSIFLRDEFSGLIEAMNKKDYYAGMAESLTKLYDGKFQKKVLRKDVIEVRDPILLLFAGGIKSKTLSLLTHEQVSSGFLPRFVFITAESDMSKRKPLGPPTEKSLGDRDLLVARMQNLHSHYNRTAAMQIGGTLVESPMQWKAELTPGAWQRYNIYEDAMLRAALASTDPETLMPVFDRLSKSGLKAAVLLAASRRLEEKIIVTEEDLMLAFHYVDGWREYALEVVNGIGRSIHERQLQQIYERVKAQPGLMKSELMRAFHLGAREASQILETLEQRGMITTNKKGRTLTLYPTTGDS